ncbi:TIGR01777 family protein [Citricoccus sp. SGAir0253]|uniref:TIGR01777 family oxidoreductase n=1 Tax=Citricoccus sp. SGAir0253 TaxID=2567881 RepID=UPI0010CCB7AC|nr:TIGR01777 family oxidoreductase [Citricoccus sp. SGAir0253]QCU78927.1 TIGR01777 family protein [Citricoccus sp. SGAir0253]
MPVFERRALLPHRRSDVFAWFTRPGALVRLTPPFAGSVRQEPDGIDVGSVARLGIGVPGSLGLGLESAAGLARTVLPVRLPAWLSPEVPWTARHTALEPDRMFRDEMASGPLRSWVHTHSFEDAAPGEADAPDGSPGCLMVDHVEYELPGTSLLDRAGRLGVRTGRWTREQFEAELDRQFAYRHEQLRADLDFHAAHAAGDGAGRSLTIAMSGASGLIGSQLAALLGGGGHRVVPLVRPGRTPTTPRGMGITWDPAAGVLDPEQLRRADVVVNLSGETIGGRMTEAHRAEVLRSRQASTSLLARTLADLAADGRRRALVSASGIGYYGADAGAGPDGEGLRETDPAGTDFLADVCRQWEGATAPAAESGVRTAMIRTGLVQTPAGGILQQVLPLFVVGAGGPLGTGGPLGGQDRDPWQSWISIDDIVGLYAHAVLTEAVEGPLNAVAPAPLRAREYAETLGRVLHRPAALPLPRVAPQLVLGAEGNRLLVEADQRVRADRALAAGYRFRHPELEDALRHVLGR